MQSEVEKDRLSFTLQLDIKAVAHLAIDFFALGDKSLTASRRLDPGQHRALFVGFGFVLKVEAGLQVNVDPTSEDRQVNVRCLVLAIGMGHWAGFDGL